MYALHHLVLLTELSADIDTIMIKSDNDGAVKVGNRSYNYRVSRGCRCLRLIRMS